MQIRQVGGCLQSGSVRTPVDLETADSEGQTVLNDVTCSLYKDNLDFSVYTRHGLPHSILIVLTQ